MSSNQEGTTQQLPTPPAQTETLPPTPPTAEESRVEMLVAGKSPNRANISYKPPPAPKNYRPLKSKSSKKAYDPNGVITPPPAPVVVKKEGAMLPPPPPVAVAVEEVAVEEVVEEEPEEEIEEYTEKDGDDKVYLLSFEKLPIAEPLNLEEKKADTKLCGTTFVDYAIYMDGDFAVLSGHIPASETSLDNIVLAKNTISERIRKLRPAVPVPASSIEERIVDEANGIYSDNSCHLQHSLNGLKKDPKYAAMVNTIQDQIKTKEAGLTAEQEELKAKLLNVTDQDICDYITSRMVVRATDSKTHMLLINLTSDLTEGDGEENGRLPAYRVRSKMLNFPASYHEKRDLTKEPVADLEELARSLEEVEDHIDKARMNVGIVHNVLEASEAA